LVLAIASEGTLIFSVLVWSLDKGFS